MSPFRAVPKEGTIAKTAICRNSSCGKTIYWVGDLFDGRWEHENGALKCDEA